MTFEQVMAWLQLGAKVFTLGSAAVARIGEAFAAEGIDPALLAQLDALYTARIEQARRESAGFSGD